jgi:thiopeptide-type bacteriocin biosynthesis protein
MRVNSPSTDTWAAPRNDDASWRSVHLYFTGDIYDVYSDAVVLGLVHPLVVALTESQAIDRFFFVRYRDQGAHIRLRLQRAQSWSEAHLDELVIRSVERIQAAGAVSAVDASSARASPPVAMRWVTYEPEYERYGGQSAMPVVEQMFHASSVLAIQLLREDGGLERQRRLGKAMLAMLVTAHVFELTLSQTIALLDRYESGYLRSAGLPSGSGKADLTERFRESFKRQAGSFGTIVVAVWDALAERDALSDPLDEFRATMEMLRCRLRELWSNGVLTIHHAPATSWERFIIYILPSILHMTNNRLGVSIPEETYLAHLIRHALRANEDIRHTEDDGAAT